jgi:LAO/AO transport system kinase
VARRTRETLLLCEAAGFDVVLVETVGVGQGETTVAQMVDTFLVLLLPGSGDELQGIKKGILELADVIAVNKADGDNVDRARLALADLKAALRYLPVRTPELKTQVLSVSGLTGGGLDDLWKTVEAHREALEKSGALQAQRSTQQLAWMWSLIVEGLEHDFRANPAIAAVLAETERQVVSGALSPSLAAMQLLKHAR